MNSNTLSEDVLRGIMAALLLHAPECLPIVEDVWRSATKTGASGRIGESISGKISCNVPLEQGEQVLATLESIKQKVGFNTRFADRSILHLISEWKRFVQPRQLPPQ